MLVVDLCFGAFRLRLRFNSIGIGMTTDPLRFYFANVPIRPASTSTLTRAMGLNPRVQQDAQEFGR